MPGHRKTAAATRLTANRSLSAPPARVSITKRNRNSSRTARTRPRRGLHDVTASQSLHAAIPQKRLITERQCRRLAVGWLQWKCAAAAAWVALRRISMTTMTTRAPARSAIYKGGPLLGLTGDRVFAGHVVFS